jgi:quercetin dioxygenase-like cupin family protein
MVSLSRTAYTRKEIEYHAGQSWVEPPGATHTRTENPSQSMPVRLLALFITPTGRN